MTETTYDEGEADTETVEYNAEELEKLQQEYDRIEAIENPIEKQMAVEQLVAELNGEV